MLGEFAVRHRVPIGMFWDFALHHWVRIEIVAISGEANPRGEAAPMAVANGWGRGR